MEILSDQTNEKGVWSPKTLVILAIVFSIFPAAILFALNYGRYGMPKKRNFCLVLTSLLFIIMIALEFFAPDWSWHRWFLITIGGVWVFYIKQIALYKKWINSGKKKASLWSALLICLIFLIILISVIALSMFIPEDDYVAYELLINGRFEEAEKVLVQSKQDYPDDPHVRNNLALLYYDTDRIPLAKQELKALLDIDPNNQDAKSLLAEIASEEISENDSTRNNIPTTNNRVGPI